MPFWAGREGGDADIRCGERCSRELLRPVRPLGVMPEADRRRAVCLRTHAPFADLVQFRASCQPRLRAASSTAAIMPSKFVLSIRSITGPVSRPIGPPLGTYR